MIELSASPSGQLLANNVPFKLKGLNWFGAEGRLDRTPYGLGRHPLSWYGSFLRSHGFNAVRLLICHEAVIKNVVLKSKSDGEAHIAHEPSLEGVTYVAMLARIASGLQRYGVLVTLVAHRLTCSTGERDLSGVWQTHAMNIWQVKNSWSQLAAALCRTNVVAVDLQNEPYNSGWGSNDPATDWRLGAEDLGNHVLAACPPWLILVEGVGDYPGVAGSKKWALGSSFWGENLQGAKYYPVRLSNPSKLVYSPHVYGPGFTSKMPYFNLPHFWDGQLNWIWQAKFGYLATEHPIIIGELGGFYDTDDDRHWHGWALRYAAKRGFGVFYFCLNPNSDDTGGVLLDDYTTPNTGKLAVLEVLPTTDICAIEGHDNGETKNGCITRTSRHRLQRH